MDDVVLDLQEAMIKVRALKEDNLSLRALALVQEGRIRLLQRALAEERGKR